MRAAVYARVSTSLQDGEDKTSLREQLASCTSYCQDRGYDLVASYSEVGSGTTRRRAEFQRMLADARRGRFDTIVCWKSDRLSRGMYPAAALMEVVEAHRLSIEAVMDAIDMKTFGLMAAIGKMELDNLRERSMLGKRGKAKQGRVPSGQNLPYGYRTGDDGRPEIVEEEAKVVRRIFDLYVGGVATATISDLMEIKTGRAWQESRLARLLGQTAYMGLWQYGQSRVTQTEAGRVRTATPEDAIEISFPLIIDRDTWDRVQALKVQRRRTAKRSTKTFYLLQHMVKCGECGSLMGGVTKAPHLKYYRCSGMRRHRLNCRRRFYVRANDLEALVWDEVSALLREPETIVSGLSQAAADDGLDEELKEAEKALARVQMEEDRAIRLFVSGRVTERQLDHQRKFITERLEFARRTVKDLSTRKAAASSHEGVAAAIREWADTINQGLDDLSDSERQEVLRLVMDGATIDKDNNVTLRVLVPSPL